VQTKQTDQDSEQDVKPSTFMYKHHYIYVHLTSVLTKDRDNSANLQLATDNMNADVSSDMTSSQLQLSCSEQKANRLIYQTHFSHNYHMTSNQSAKVWETAKVTWLLIVIPTLSERYGVTSRSEY